MPECTLLWQSVQEASLITASKIESIAISDLLRNAHVNNAMLFAIVMYTFDLCLLTPDYSKKQCWYFALNLRLRKRDKAFLQVGHGYLYYLMTGLTRLKPYGDGIGGILWRGIDAEGSERVLREYTDGRHFHWRGFSSATPDLRVAKSFAGLGGVILRIDLVNRGSASRDIRILSAITDESEILILPNFSAVVTGEATFNPEIGLKVIDVKELAAKPIDFF